MPAIATACGVAAAALMAGRPVLREVMSVWRTPLLVVTASLVLPTTAPAVIRDDDELSFIDSFRDRADA